ncbi:GLPGLI family protein [Pedobacter gandavensis]|uniref:GLPGLI family protein n=1 Tax=Pedobacter gandavensis TaxID=2679963 RepID=A0ABR6EQN2_9SPHI|nr:GLPGLI family protein [Pedobacter gandavensis]MBB2147551.1 GLPGLI family protein [Pedobacter gandavensis]
MKTLLIALSFCCFSNLAFAQKTDKKIQDTVTVRCYYLLSKKKDASSPVYRRDTMVLDIGKRISRFYDPARLGRDSAVSNLLEGINSSEITSMNVYKNETKDISNVPGTKQSNAMEGESYQILKDKQTGLLTVFDYLSNYKGSKFQYEDPFPKLDWKLVEGSDTIANYACQKALLNFRGRSYTAWFSPDIPINDGPWKFSGLPGLILKVEDTAQLFSFTLIGMTQPKTVLPIALSKTDFLKCTRAELAQQQKKQGMGTQINFSDGVVNLVVLPGKYEPILMELE